ncbi:MAG: helix-turn-helix transcriptional regulator [Planctomycetota bacterium]
MSDSRATPLTGPGDCPCSGRNLDKLIQPAVLAILAQGEKPLHGYRIVQSLASMPLFGGHEPDNTGVYRFLNAMEDRGLLTSAWDMSAAGPAKKLFDLTREGRRCLAKWTATLQEYREQIGQLLDHLQRAAARPVSRCRCQTKPRRKVAPASPKRPGKA